MTWQQFLFWTVILGGLVWACREMSKQDKNPYGQTQHFSQPDSDEGVHHVQPVNAVTASGTTTEAVRKHPPLERDDKGGYRRPIRPGQEIIVIDPTAASYCDCTPGRESVVPRCSDETSAQSAREQCCRIRPDEADGVKA